MFNQVSREHGASSPNCRGDLNFDYTAEQQRGMCWREKVICDKCVYKSKPFNLFEEIETGKRGRKAATANVGLHVALTQTSIGPNSVRRLCLGSNIPAPSRNAMYYSAAKVCKDIERINTADMKMRRNGLKKINKLRGRPENEINIQADGIYNNSLYSGVGKTPFQPATQCSYVIAENMTDKKQVISLANVNKLCSKHGFHSSESNQCNIVSGECTSTTPMEKSIGNEKKWAKQCLLDLKTDHLEPKYITTDPDSSAYRAAIDLHTDKKNETYPEFQIDTRHVGENQRKYIKRRPLVLNMMPGLTKCYRERLRNRFSTDLSMRCKAEFENLHQQVKGDCKSLKVRIGQAKQAVMLCYSGDHILCPLHSSVCDGTNSNNWIIKSPFLPDTFRIDISNPKHKQTLTECINYRLGSDILEKTKLNTNTQKVESVNQIIRRSLPKRLTFSRCFPGRAHSAIFSANNGPGESLVKLCEETGCPISTKCRVAAALLTEQVQSEKQKKRAKSVKRKLARKRKRQKLFEIYEKHQEEDGYQKGILLQQGRTVGQLRIKTKPAINYGNAYSVRLDRQAQQLHNTQGGACAIVHTPSLQQ